METNKLDDLKKEYEIKKLKLMLDQIKNTPNVKDPVAKTWKIEVLETRISRMENNIVVTPELKLDDMKKQLRYYQTKGDIPVSHVNDLVNEISVLEKIVNKN
ncbi:MAG: hypothetical protein LLG04_08625 [Parachlamydia sp.]|nr:hypothetical protein [Parachlamydia sp.]